MAVKLPRAAVNACNPLIINGLQAMAVDRHHGGGSGVPELSGV
jgi:hypothetical protein